ncbi:MAG: hemolysin III family protein [Alphaproteobacteria bacterium]|nr:hemolysin III family protein [Alphaproteobacteria bacterium]
MIKKPLLRGRSHEAMFFVSVGALLMLMALTTSGFELISIVVYAFGVVSMLGISALYHRVNWSVENRALMRKFDHSAIYLMIAGTFTPVAMLGLSDQSMRVLLWTIWIVAIVGIVKSIWFTNLPKFLNAILYLATGVVIFPYMTELFDGIGLMSIVLLAAGGIVYAIGAVIYAVKRPNPWPLYFGYHEVFHLLVIVAAIFHFIMVYLILIK